jgi:hypothetical protein
VSSDSLFLGRGTEVEREEGIKRKSRQTNRQGGRETQSEEERHTIAAMPEAKKPGKQVLHIISFSTAVQLVSSLDWIRCCFSLYTPIAFTVVIYEVYCHICWEMLR